MAIVDRIVDEGGEVFNVKAYGARGDGATDDTAAIQAAINAATAAETLPTTDPDYPYRRLGRGGIVFFPPGEYAIRAPGLELPRTKTLALVGSGPGATSITATTGALSSATPLVRWTFTSNQQVEYFRMEGLTLARSDEGPVLVYSMPTDNVVFERLLLAVFRHVYFRAATSTGSAETVRISGALSCHFEDISVFGGGTGFVLNRSSHCLIQNFRTDIDSSLAAGMRIIGGGNHVLSDIRIEATSGGPGIQLEGGTSNVQIHGAYFEGKKTNPQINVDDASNITILHPALALPSVAASGLRLSASARNVRVIGGLVNDFTQQAGAVAIKVENGARLLLVERMAINHPSNPSANPAGNVEIGATATGIRVQVYDARAGYTEHVFTSTS
jgi:hypothetical protein